MPRPKKNKNRADEATTGATGSATKPDREAGSSGFGTTFASASAAMAGPKADLFGDDDDDDNDGLGQEVELKVNDKFAARLEHNKKREELQRRMLSIPPLFYITPLWCDPFDFSS